MANFSDNTEIRRQTPALLPTYPASDFARFVVLSHILKNQKLAVDFFVYSMYLA